MVPISVMDWNHLCWEGSPWKPAADIMAGVMNACERAVTLAPTDGFILDSRGLARALTGDFNGAIMDFQVYVDQLKDEKKREQRQGWIDALRARQNPFTSEELKRLRNPRIMLQ